MINNKQKREQFIKQIEVVEDKDKQVISEIQRNINNNGNNIKYISNITKKLTNEQLNKLE